MLPKPRRRPHGCESAAPERSARPRGTPQRRLRVRGALHRHRIPSDRQDSLTYGEEIVVLTVDRPFLQ